LPAVLDPEQLTFAQWFWIVFAMVLAVMFICRCIELTDPEEPIGFSSPSLARAETRWG